MSGGSPQHHRYYNIYTAEPQACVFSPTAPRYLVAVPSPDSRLRLLEELALSSPFGGGSQLTVGGIDRTTQRIITAVSRQGVPFDERPSFTTSNDYIGSPFVPYAVYHEPHFGGRFSHIRSEGGLIDEDGTRQVYETQRQLLVGDRIDLLLEDAEELTDRLRQRPSYRPTPPGSTIGSRFRGQTEVPRARRLHFGGELVPQVQGPYYAQLGGHQVHFDSLGIFLPINLS